MINNLKMTRADSYALYNIVKNKTTIKFKKLY
jgi:hypothetical protein